MAECTELLLFFPVWRLSSADRLTSPQASEVFSTLIKKTNKDFLDELFLWHLDAGCDD